MAATIVLIKVCGDSGYEAETEVSDINLKDIDDATTPIEDVAVEIPSEGTGYSYESWVRFKCLIAPANEITNFKIWSEGTVIATGVSISINTTQMIAYSTPVKTQSTQGTRDNFKNRGVASKIDVEGDIVGVGEKTNFMVFQLEAGSSAAPGNVSDTCNYSYEEN